MLDTWVQCVFSAGLNWVHRLASSSRAFSSSAMQVRGVAPISFAVPRQLAAILKFGKPRAPRRGTDRWGFVAVLADPVVSTAVFAQAAMIGLLCASRTRQEACRSVGSMAGARRGPQEATRTISSGLQVTEQPSALQLVRRTRSDDAPSAGPSPGGPGSACGPWGPGGPAMPAGPGGPASPFSPWGPVG